MHILAGLIAILGTLAFWAIRLGANRKNIGDAANMIEGAAIKAKNMPRQRRFKKAHNKRGYDLIETPLEAAVVLMIATARSGDIRNISEAERRTIEAQLCANMHLSSDDADGLLRQIDSITHDIVLPESALFPMVEILRDTIDRDDARELADMMHQVAIADGAPTGEQKEFLRRFRENFDLN